MLAPDDGKYRPNASHSRSFVRYRYTRSDPCPLASIAALAPDPLPASTRQFVPPWTRLLFELAAARAWATSALDGALPAVARFTPAAMDAPPLVVTAPVLRPTSVVDALVRLRSVATFMRAGSRPSNDIVCAVYAAVHFGVTSAGDDSAVAQLQAAGTALRDAAASLATFPRDLDRGLIKTAAKVFGGDTLLKAQPGNLTLPAAMAERWPGLATLPLSALKLRFAALQVRTGCSASRDGCGLLTVGCLWRAFAAVQSCP